MPQIKNKVLESLDKLSNRDTHQIAIADMEMIIRTVPQQEFMMLLNCLLHDWQSDASVDSSKRHSATSANRGCLRLLAFFCSTHPESASPHLSKIISHVVRRIKDSSSDTPVRDACRDAVGSLSRLYLGTINHPSAETYSSQVSQFVNPFLEVMAQQNKGAQAAAALCLAKVIDCAVGEQSNKERSNAVGLAFQNMVPSICMLLDCQSFINKSALLTLVSSLSQIGAIAQQEIQTLLQLVLQCMENSDWTTRKASADALSVLAINSSTHLLAHWVSSTLSAIEACRFDKVKPVRDSMAEALGLWKKIGDENKEDGALDRRKSLSGENKLSKTYSSPEKSSNVLRKKLPASLNGKKLNPNFFRKLETKISDDLTTREVVLPHKQQDLRSEGGGGEEEESSNLDGIHGNVKSGEESKNKKAQDQFEYGLDRLTEKKVFNIKDSKLRNLDSDEMVNTSGSCRSNIHAQGSWLMIRRQLTQLERQQADLLNMFQDFMGCSRENMMALENRVSGLERVVDKMAKDLAMSCMRISDMSMGFNFCEHAGQAREGQMQLCDSHSYSSGPRNNSLTRTRRGWDKGYVGPCPSARKGWDKATLETIRGAGGVEGNEMRRTINAELDSGGLIDCNNLSVQEKQLRNCWIRAIDSIHAGDADTAYAESLGNQDIHLLVKLMEYTGPIIDLLSNEIRNEVVGRVARFLLERSLRNIALAWIHQMMELVVENGAECLDGIHIHNKREILMSLHTVEPSERWKGVTAKEMMVQLATSWRINIQQLVN